jgi:hypothetical protein
MSRSLVVERRGVPSVVPTTSVPSAEPTTERVGSCYTAPLRGRVGTVQGFLRTVITVSNGRVGCRMCSVLQRWTLLYALSVPSTSNPALHTSLVTVCRTRPLQRYRINWHIICGPCETNALSQEGAEKRDLLCTLDGLCAIQILLGRDNDPSPGGGL